MNLMECDKYSRAQIQSFYLHVAIAILCVPFYIVSPHTFGLLTSPYVFFLAIRPRPEFLLPIIMQMAYGGQQRYFFCLGCFVYVLFHSAQLRRYKVSWIYWIYMALTPFFVWFFYQKLMGPRYVGSIGEVTGGLGTFFLFSTFFWALLAVRNLDRRFFVGLLYWSLFLVLSVSVGAGGESASDDEGFGFFSRSLFWAIPYIIVSSYCLMMQRRRQILPLIASLGGTILLILDFVRILRYPITFTQTGLAIFAVLTLIVARKFKSITKNLNPIFLFCLSTAVVLYSSELVATQGGKNADLGEYSEMSMTSISSIFQKLQRKVVDDRASLWGFYVEAIKKKLKDKPIWVDLDPVVRAVSQTATGEFVEWQTTMNPHNTALFLLWHYGLYGGFGLYLVYCIFFCRRDVREMLVLQSKNNTSILLSICLVQGVFGAHTGHYPVTLAMGPILFSVLGAAIRQGYEIKRWRANVGFWR